MKNLLLVASAALFSFAAVAQTGPATVAGQTPADGRAYGQAVAARAKYDKQAKPLSEQQKAEYKARQDARKVAYKAQTEQEKAAYKAQYEARKAPYKSQQEARKDADKAQHEAAKDADKLVKHERSARGGHAHGGGHQGHAKPAKAPKMK